MSHMEPSCETQAANYGTSEILEKTGISLRQLYYWETEGFIKPAYQRCGRRLFRRYREEDLERIFEIKAWLDLGFSLAGARKLMNWQSHAALNPSQPLEG